MSKLSYRMNKQVFISHSSKDHQFAMRLVEFLEANGIYCWIAPRDIPYGHKWPAEIVEAIETSKIMLFVFTEHSNHSNQVIREINCALENGVLVIPIRLKEIPYNKSLRYYLSTVQWAESYFDESNSAQWFSDIHQKIKKYLETGLSEELFETVSYDQEERQETFDIDYGDGFDLEDILAQKFSALFPKGHSREPETVSPLRKKLLDRVCDRYIQDVWMSQKDEENGTIDNWEQDTEREDMYFSITETDSITFLFVMKKYISLPEHRIYNLYTECPRTVDEFEDGTVEVTFRIPAEAVNFRTGNPLLIITVLERRQLFLLNFGFIDPISHKVLVSKNPTPLEYKSIHGSSEDKILRMSFPRDSRYLVIDPVTGEAVHPRYIDDRKQGKKGWFVDIYPNREYLFCDADWNHQFASPRDIAYGYYYGENGLPESIIDAAEWFDRWGTKEAYQMLAHIFRTDPVIGSEEDAQYYEGLAQDT